MAYLNCRTTTAYIILFVQVCSLNLETGGTVASNFQDSTGKWHTWVINCVVYSRNIKLEKIAYTVLIKREWLVQVKRVLSRDVKRTSNLRTSKFIFEFEFGILTFDIRVKFTLEQMWALKSLRTRRNVFVLCRRLMPATSPADCRGDRQRCWCLITPPAPPHTSSVAVCLSVRTVWLLSCQRSRWLISYKTRSAMKRNLADTHSD